LKWLAAIGLLAGLAVLMLLVLSYGAGAIWHSAALLGLPRFGVIVAVHLVLIAFMGSAWWLLTPEHAWAKLKLFWWGRLIRDSASEALPLSQIGGYVLGARALAVTGVPGAFAAASTVVDVTVELVAQLGYTMLGLLLLERLRPGTGFAGPVLIGLVAMSAAAGLFAAVQARGAGFVERIGARLAREFLGRRIGEAGAVQAGIHDIHRRPAMLALAATVHFTTWLLAGVETWLTLNFMGLPVPLLAAITIDSLVYGMRSVAFMVPNAIGVQEGALVLLGGLFGVPPDAALALSLIKRARDLVIGVPALLAWQLIEGRNAWRKSTLPIAVTPKVDSR
jgi:putative membrane protein